jgi:hypothetical protein
MRKRPHDDNDNDNENYNINRIKNYDRNNIVWKTEEMAFYQEELAAH